MSAYSSRHFSSYIFVVQAYFSSLHRSLDGAKAHLVLLVAEWDIWINSSVTVFVSQLPALLQLQRRFKNMASCLKENLTGYSLLGLREVVPDQTGVEQWKELLLNTGNISRLDEPYRLQFFLRQPKRCPFYVLTFLFFSTRRNSLDASRY